MLGNVCIDGTDIPPGVANGTGVYAVELARRLPDAIVTTVPKLERALQSLGLRTATRVPACDVFHRPSQIFSRAALDTFLRAPGRAVLTYLDLIAYRTPSLFPDAAAHERYCALSFASLKAAQAVIAISEHARREILDEFELPAERVHVTPLGVDAGFFGTLRAPVYNARYFFITSSDFPHKNLALLLRAYAWLRARWRSPEPLPDLVMAGQRTRTGGVYDLGAEPAPGVKWLGTVERSTLAALYQHAVGFVYPSSYEGFGLPVLEAMAAGTPVVCARLTSLPEVAGEAALYLDDLSMDELAARMLALATDSALRSRLIALGRERVRGFTWDETARRTRAVYEQASPDDAERRRLATLLGTARG